MNSHFSHRRFRLVGRVQNSMDPSHVAFTCSALAPNKLISNFFFSHSLPSTTLRTYYILLSQRLWHPLRMPYLGKRGSDWSEWRTTHSATRRKHYTPMPRPISDRYSLRTLKLDILHPKLLKLLELSFFHDLKWFWRWFNLFWRKNQKIFDKVLRP